MATNEDINSTGNVSNTQSPQSSSGSNTNSNTVQKTANPDEVNSNESLNVQQTGEPITGFTPLGSSSTGAFVLAAIGAVVVVGIALLIIRIKNFSSISSGASL